MKHARAWAFLFMLGVDGFLLMAIASIAGPPIGQLINGFGIGLFVAFLVTSARVWIEGSPERWGP